MTKDQRATIGQRVLGPQAKAGVPFWDSAEPSTRDEIMRRVRDARAVPPATGQVANAAADAATNPTASQKEAGNYPKGHARWNGLDLSIENAKGATRGGTSPDGRAWSVEMPAHYGYVRGTRGADGDHVDFYMGPNEASDFVLIVDQKDVDSGQFDEHKVILGTQGAAEAIDLYKRGFSDGRGADRIGGVREMNVVQFRQWLDEGDTSKPVSPQFEGHDRAAIQPAPRPQPGSADYTRDQAVADLHAMEAQRDGGMIADARLEDRIQRQAALVRSMSQEAARDGDQNPINKTFAPEREEKQFDSIQAPPNVTRSAQGDQKSAPQRAPGYGAKNKLVSADRAAALRERLSAKLKSQINSGIDPEIIAIGTELAVFHIEAGARRFGDFVTAMANDLGQSPAQLRRFLRGWYNGARDMMEDAGADIEGMDGPADVRAALDAIPTQEQPASRQDLDDSPAHPQAETNTPAQQKESDDAKRDSASSDRASAQTRNGNAEGRYSGDGGGRSSGSGERGAGLRSDGDGRSRRSGDAARDGDAGRAGRIDEQLGPRNHVIEPGGIAAKGGDKTRARNSVRAIEVLRRLEAEKRPATAEERQALSLYGGAGTLAAALPNSEGKIRFPDIATDLDRLLTEEERATLERTSQYAFYTAEPVLRGMWSLAQQLGFKGGRVFEPGMGVGGFAGTMPRGISASYRGIELDHVTAKIAAHLYPKHQISQGDFIQTPMVRDYYDLVIGNPPFARTQVKADPDYRQGFMLHDYFFAKSMDAVRPGGLLMFVTSAGTLNKLDSKARDYLADRADLVGAIRLPNTAFSENGTQVTTDIVVLRKRLPGEAEASKAWRESVTMPLPDKDGGTVDLPVNRYFHDNPGMVLGEQGAFDTLVGRSRVGVRPRHGSDLATDLGQALRSLPRNVMSDATDAKMVEAPRDALSSETKTGAYYLRDGQLWQFDGREGRAVERRSKDNPRGMAKAAYDLIQQLLPIRDALRAVYAADLSDQDAGPARVELNRLYDRFVSERGPINKVVKSYRRPSSVQMEGLRQKAAEDARAAGMSFDPGSFDGGAMIAQGATLAQVARARKQAMEQSGYRDGDFRPDEVADLEVKTYPNIDAFADDPENFRLRAIERYDEKTGIAEKTLVFTENAVRRSTAPKISSPEDALLHGLAETGRIDLDRIAEQTGRSVGSVMDELAGKVFENPETGEIETRSKYLSGNVRQKLDAARRAEARDSRYHSNVTELEAVQPDPIPRTEITLPVGAHWFPAELYGEFARAKGLRLDVGFKRALGIWTVDGDNSSADARNRWGTEDLPFADLMRLVMNNKAIRVTRTRKNGDGTTTSFVDEEATQAANDKAAELRAEFQQWMWSDEKRATDLEGLYNETFNAEVAPKFDGGYLTTPGVNATWSWRPHQRAVVARILQAGSTYMAHGVGAGKTSAMIGAGMEARRLGLARRPLYAVPNHMLVQFATEFQHQYPLANILVADERRFHTDRRKQFIADATLGDYDAIIMTHSSFEMIPSSPQAKARVVEGILADLREMIESGSETGDRGKDRGQQQATLGALKSIAAQLGVDTAAEKGTSTAKQIAQIMEQAEQRLSRMTSDTGKDQVFTFDEMGVDMLFVDEAHLFRKLSFATTNGNIKGIDPQGSQASMDLLIKTRTVDQNNPGRGLIFASGTPITNTMAELFSISRFLQPQALEDRGIAAFDAWAATFGEVASELEQLPDGGYKEVARFSKFVNTPELSLMVRQVMDVVTGKDLDKFVTRPKLKGGKRNLVVVEPGDEVKAYQNTLAQRMRAIAARKGPVKKGDDILLSVINDCRLSAIDPRLVDPHASGRGSKLERMIENIYRRWKAGTSAPLHSVKPEGGYTEKPTMHGASTQIVFSTLGIEASKH
ncbi:MAG: hypothetical protein Q4G26_10460, partial [Paracoccus sp. (in: a-proteobacteria)]|nr:hypothetical protein [Paracoccus sp. (in: a-proteobacteria)]